MNYIICDKYGNKVARSFERIVQGMTRPYIEFSDEDRLTEFYIPSNKRWRLNTYRSISFLNYTPSKDSDVIIYKQLRPAKYGDFTIGKYHIAIEDIKLISKDMNGKVFAFDEVYCKAVSEAKPDSCKECYFDSDRALNCSKQMTDVCSHGLIFDRLFNIPSNTKPDYTFNK